MCNFYLIYIIFMLQLNCLRMLITLKDFAKNPLTITSLKPKHVKINYTVKYSPICYLYLCNTNKYKGKT